MIKKDREISTKMRCVHHKDEVKEGCKGLTSFHQPGLSPTGYNWRSSKRRYFAKDMDSCKLDGY